MENVRGWTKKYGRSCLNRRNILTFACLVGVAVGITVGVILKNFVRLTAIDKAYLRFPGELLYRLLRLVLVPLLMTNVILGVYEAKVSPSRKITKHALTYFIITTILALLSGVLFAQVIKPGVIGTNPKVEEDEEALTIWESIKDLLMNMVPQNIIHAFYQTYKTQKFLVNVESNDPKTPRDKKKRQVQKVCGYVEETNMLGLIVVSVVSGLALRTIRQHRQAFVEIVQGVNIASKHLVKVMMCYMPVGVAFLLVSYVSEMSDDWKTLVSVGKFLAVVLCGLTFHGAVVLPLIYLLLTRQNPVCVFRGIYPALLKALLVSRTFAATRTFKCCDDVLKIDRRITDFVLPIAVRFIMNGTALYEMAAVVYIAQLTGITLHWSRILTIGLTVAVSTVGEAGGVPVTGTATTLFVLTISRIPLEAAAVLLVTEWFLDHFNAVVNVLGHCIGVALVEHVSKKELQEMDEEATDASGEDDSSEEPVDLESVRVNAPGPSLS